MNQQLEDDNINVKINKIEANLLEQEHRPFKLIWNFIQRKKKYKENDPRRKAVSKAILWRLFLSPTTIAITLSGILGYATLFFLWKQNTILENQNKLINQQTQLSEASRRSSQMILLDGVLKDINKELNYNKKISNNLTTRIVSLSHMIKPYKYYDYQKDTISKLLSPERSQLLHSIIGSELNPSYLSDTLFKKTNFKFSDLNGLILYNTNLKNAKLRYSSLEGTLLHNSNLTNVDLRDSNIKSTGMPNTNMTKIDFRKSNLNDVNLLGAILDSSDLRHTTFRNLNIGNIKSLNGAKVHRSDWFNYLKDSLKVDGVENLIAKYQVKNVFYENMKIKIFTVVKK